IIVDSSSSITKEEAKKLGIILLPLIITINGKDYRDGVDITPSEYFKNIKINDEIRTSATSIGIIEETLKKASEKFDHVIVYPLSTKLSSQNQNIQLISKNFDNVHVLNSHGVGLAIKSDVLNIKKFYKTEKNIHKIVEYSQSITNKQFGILIPSQLDWLVKGGRVKKSIAVMAKMASIFPIIQFKDGSLSKWGKGRNQSKSFIKASKVVQKSSGENTKFIIMHSGFENIDLLASKMEKELNIKIEIGLCPPVIVNHIGTKALIFLSISK
ncbi:MAG: DegV family protein, partial [Mollicutes bacterium PWAP]|nr:DegV family protein [Mollicutes bacterium PWAP]